MGLPTMPTLPGACAAPLSFVGHCQKKPPTPSGRVGYPILAIENPSTCTRVFQAGLGGSPLDGGLLSPGRAFRSKVPGGTLYCGGMSQYVDVALSPSGQPVRVLLTGRTCKVDATSLLRFERRTATFDVQQ